MVLGIIAEYNPFHNGHLYHLSESKKETGANYVVAVIGGNFTQRGEASIINKWTKANMAVENGIDLVIELPTIYSVSSAENFADGAIKILNSLKIVDTISFGTETEDLNKLNIVANILYNEPKEYKELLEKNLRQGKSFPRAREEAIIEFLQDTTYSEILTSSNNILAIEYLKSLKKHKSNIKPIYIKRKDVGHLSLEYNSEIASATAIRGMIKETKFNDIKEFVPERTFKILNNELNNGHIVFKTSEYEDIIMYNLRNMSLDEIAKLPDVSEGLENVIKKAVNSCNKLEEAIDIISTKRYTKTRIRRILMYALLKIKKSDMELSKKINPYIRVLAFNKNGKELISKIKKQNPKAKIIVSVKQFMDTNKNKNLKLLMEKDIMATNVYTLGYLKDSYSNLDYTKKLN